MHGNEVCGINVGYEHLATACLLNKEERNVVFFYNREKASTGETTLAGGSTTTSSQQWIQLCVITWPPSIIIFLTQHCLHTTPRQKG